MQPVKLFLLLEHHAALAVRHQVNPLRANPTKWSNTLKQFADCCQRIVSVCLTILLALEGLNPLSNRTLANIFPT